MSSPGANLQSAAEDEVRYYRERLSILRAKAYGGRLVSGTRVRELERALASAERRLRGDGSGGAHL